MPPAPGKRTPAAALTRTPLKRPAVPVVDVEARGPLALPRSRRPSILPEGPFAVPISTMDWLVSRESPAVRFVTLRDLLQRPPKDIELRKARQGLSADPYLRDALPLLRRALQQGPLDTRYGGGLWQTLFLLDLGCDASQPELARAGDALLAWWQLTFVEIERNQDSRIDLGLFSQSLRALVRLGYGEDPRVLAGAELVARRRIASSAAALDPAPLVKDLLLFSEIPKPLWRPPMHQATEFAVARLLAKGVVLETRLNFPNADETDLLEALWALSRCGVPRKPEVEPLLGKLASRADHRGRFRLDVPQAAKLPLPLERDGELSRWVTVRGLCVMQHFAGLTVAEKRT
ncbi:MAG: hypothetical protein JNK60_02610 [Acidobacteria bacterium]|nr:hypothetical protein [Acidobacteriota bacterium]